jgi:hypothetical protein
MIARYADGGPGLDEAALWSVEVHLETCAECRAELAGGAPDSTLDLLERVAAGLDREITAGPPPAPVRRRWSAVNRRWLVATLLPWLSMTAAVLTCAFLLDQLRLGLPSLVLLLAPLAPLPGVAVAWSRRADPAGELIAATPAAGLTMLLRRTAGVLVVVVPLLAVLGVGGEASLALMLVPCLACTAVTIALGGLLGVRRAAIGVGVAWALAVVLPSVIRADIPVVLRPESIPFWVAATVVLAALAALRAGDYRRIASHD